MTYVEVIAGIVKSANKVLIARKKKGKSLAGYWEFPGGKIESDENHKACLIREFAEEFSIKIEVHEFVGLSEYTYEQMKIHLYAYFCSTEDFNFKLTDHDKIKWVEIDELKKYQLAPADIPFIKILSNLSFC